MQFDNVLSCALQVHPWWCQVCAVRHNAGDTVRVMASEARARAVSEARTDRAQEHHVQRLDKLAQDHFETVVDDDTGEETKCVRNADLSLVATHAIYPQVASTSDLRAFR